MDKAPKEKKKSDTFIITLVPVLIIIVLLVAAYLRNMIWKNEITFVDCLC